VVFAVISSCTKGQTIAGKPEFGALLLFAKGEIVGL
jgi:hypothetical protein